MKTFYQFLENLNPGLIFIDLDPYKKQANNKAKELLDYAYDRNQKLSNFKLDINLIKNGLKNFPTLTQLLNSLNKELNQNNWSRVVGDYLDKVRKDLDINHKKETEELRKMGASQQDLSKLYQKQSEERYESWNLGFKAYMHLNDYYASKEIEQINEKEYYDLAEKAIEETNKNMIELKSVIENIISKIDWKGSKVRIVPSMSDSNEDPVPPTDSATIVVGKEGLFSYFKGDDRKFIIDDIIEDDEDFFANENEKQDYYNLVDYLQNPNKKEQILTLYTARPVKDRKFYSKTNYLPAGVFLSNSLDHVDGLASDLSSSDRRDVYKVRINSKYLIKTLDGLIKYYMVKNDSPFERISLL